MSARARQRLPGTLRDRARAVRAAVRAHHFAGLEHLFQTAQVAFDLLFGSFAEELGDGGSERAGWRVVFNFDADFGAAIARRRA